ncbi:MAG: UbiA family prenyltransferase [Candidatus Marinimicrobia bacterium]|nr:UbiA family prenyltransferase [Candidatus Neomarinimicrobiota bacterium]MBT3635124.1 UbiA family prenyltransferase [Candidatus Neomarinimicrobiota bacterium]MBT3683005.1 UbiA family prenyltransferase [Candidatus Neomarinimicrobiota bacterium]MBT3759903.1 UbiA family prenyltransferase [Candidatus Neomarinimicrobiota bacterium]MBT3895644.1 UbiA family prenyltransferase [Candidatus Neomarinimicrobiota bacterium]
MIIKIKFIFDVIKNHLRIKQVWNYKIPVILSYAFICIYLTRLTVARSVLMLLFYIIFMLGAASFAYLLNDYFDRESDEKVGKTNIFRKIDPEYFPIFVVISLAFALTPWLYLPINRYTILLLAFLFFLFTVYSIPSTRIKNKGFWGVIVDAMYAHAIWVLLTFYTFAVINVSYHEIDKRFLIAFFCWQFVLGVRNITFHQIADYDNDLSVNGSTWVVRAGLETATKFVKYIILPLEFILFLNALLAMSKYFIIIIPVTIFFWIFTFIKRKYISKISSGIDYRQFAYTYLDEYYNQWFPTLILINMVINHRPYFVLLFAFLFLFRNIISTVLYEIRVLYFK